MPPAPRIANALGLCLALLVLNSCLTHQRSIVRQGNQPAKQALLSATREELAKRISDRYRQVKSFSATVDMTPSVGSVYKGSITEYRVADVLAYILFRKPDEVRIIGKTPVVRSTAFDMASDGTDFRLYLPAKNRFVEGRNDLPATSPNKLENLRPAAFATSLLIRPVDPETEFSVLFDYTDEEHAFYILLIMRRIKGGDPLLARNVWFDRLSLQIVRQQTFDDWALITSDTRYSKWQNYSGIPFPNTIDINRPEDGYGVLINITKLDMNAEIGEDRFILQQPEGTQLQVLGAASPAPPAIKAQ
ncbi:MAG: hypothetical protein M3Z23_12890 [Acidobacteriota bacterium]|nr:hypothetical protein [Acidobacteriota bacterium]